MVELNAFGMTRRGDLTSPATNEIQSGPPTLMDQRRWIPVCPTHAKQHHMRASKTPFILNAEVSPTKGPGDRQNRNPNRSFNGFPPSIDTTV